jgi:2-amino-4-hydroxy-6-hydroxymethyldihydropteridine diphosphokinase
MRRDLLNGILRDAHRTAIRLRLSTKPQAPECVAMSTTAYLALGSNLGDRRENLDRAVQMLRETPGIIVRAVSHYQKTEPVGGPAGQGTYLNAAVGIVTDLSPENLLRTCLAIESQLGRIRAQRFGPRTIDIDLLLYGDLVTDLHTPDIDLTVPHPRMHERLFVLEPLDQIATLAVHPRLKSTVSDLLRGLRGSRNQPSTRELAGKCALVTGSTSGIGRAIALELAGAGADVIVHGRGSEAVDAVADEVLAAGVRTKTILADLREIDQCIHLVSSAWLFWDRIDIWVNNAGADTLTGEASQWTFLRKLHELLTVDVTATVVLSREAGRHMKGEGGGVILNMGWDQAETGMEGESGQLFAAAKGAVMSFTKSLALSLAPEVRVNCLAPGWIKTAWGENASQSWQDRAMREAPLGRWGTPEDVAKVARWLVSPGAAFLTGQIIRVNGGAVR